MTLTLEFCPLVLCDFCKSCNFSGPLSPCVQNKADDLFLGGCYERADVFKAEWGH